MIVGTAFENFAAPLTLPCQAESRGYYIDAADYRAEPPFAQYILRASPRGSLSLSLCRNVKYLTEFQRGISNGRIDRSHRLALVGHKLRAYIPRDPSALLLSLSL